MPHRVTRYLRRSRTEWVVRAGLALFAMGLGYIAVTHSLAQVLRRDSPARAHALAPDDGRITAQLATKLASADADAALRAESDRLARQALRQDPTAVAAVATLGLNAQIAGDSKAARRYFAYSDKLSRRDLKTRLWMIEDAVARDDIPEALRNYDIALRTSRSAPDILYPVLASAISDMTIRAELVRTLAAQPSWSQGFIAFVGGNGPDAQAAAILFRALRNARVPISNTAQAAVINRLIADARYDAAWAYYASVWPAADRRRSRDPQFAANLESPSSFDWTSLGGNSGVATVIQSGPQGGLFDFAAPASVGGPLLQQMQLLPPGDYLLEGRSIDIDQLEGARPYWVLVCLDGREFGRLVLPNSVQNGGRFRGRFIVPSGCPAQYIRLVARPSNAIGGLSGHIAEAMLRPAN